MRAVRKVRDIPKKIAARQYCSELSCEYSSLLGVICKKDQKVYFCSPLIVGCRMGSQGGISQ